MTRKSRPIAECRWSVPAFRPDWKSDDDALERYWLCDRTALAIPVTQTACDRCRYWSREGAGGATLRRRS